MNGKSHQAQSEYRAGYQHGLNGGEKPGRDKGSAYFGGYLCGKAEREDRQASTQDISG